MASWTLFHTTCVTLLFLGGILAFEYLLQALFERLEHRKAENALRRAIDPYDCPACARLGLNVIPVLVDSEVCCARCDREYLLTLDASEKIPGYVIERDR